MTNNADIEKYGYSDYGTGFDRRWSFLFLSSGFCQNVLIFRADMSSSAHIDNKEKRHINSRNRTDTGVRTYIKCKKSLFNQFYCYKQQSLLKHVLQWSK